MTSRFATIQTKYMHNKSNFNVNEHYLHEIWYLKFWIICILKAIITPWQESKLKATYSKTLQGKEQ